MGAVLAASGSTSVAANDLNFSGLYLTNQAIVLLAAASSLQSGGVGTPFGDGLRCLANPAQRLSSGYSSRPGGGAIVFRRSAIPGAPWNPGDTRYFQLSYRDRHTTCGNTFDSTDASSIVFTP